MTGSHRRAREALLLGSNYPPEVGPSPRRALLLVAALRTAGFDVTVSTWQPHNPQRKVWPGHRRLVSTENSSPGVHVIRVRPALMPSRWLRVRAIAELITSVFSGVVPSLAARRPGLVVATTPAMFLGPVGAVVARAQGAPFVWDVRDLIWEYAEQAGAASWLGRWLRRVMLRTAAAADVIMTATRAQAAYFVERGCPEGKVVCVPNPVDPDWLERTRPIAAAYGACNAPEWPLKVLYAGLLGIPQGLQVVLDAAEMLPDDKYQFVLAGTGPDAERLRRQVRARRLRNVTFLGYLGSDALLEAYDQADVCYAQLRASSIFATAFPTKLLEYMAAGRPLIFGGDGEARRFITEVGCGLGIESDSPHALVGALKQLEVSSAVRLQMGHAGRTYVEEHRSFSTTRDVVADLLRAASARGTGK